MSKSNAVLREVGTTNRTRIADYEKAITEKTRLLLRVHRSNFEIVGFTEQPSLEELVALGRRRNIPVLEDLGSGALIDLASMGLPSEPTVADSLRAGVDVVTYSGDKLLGGPQAGMLSGKPEHIARVRSNPMFRALRVDKLIYAALEATLLAYIKRDHDAIPALRMMRLSAADVEARAEQFVNKLRRSTNFNAELLPGESVIGGGAAPGSNLPTILVAISGESFSADQFAMRLRQNDPPVIARVEERRVLIDLRTVFPEQESAILAALESIAQS
jgi:L-seryl-tRNA(Ser) seleniumtransferase